MAAAYSVLLFLILMVLGYFYVRALSGNEQKERRAHDSTNRCTATPRSRKGVDVWRWAGRIFLAVMLLSTPRLPMVWMLLTSIKSGFRGDAVPAAMVAERTHARQLQEAARSQNSVGQDFLRFFWNSLFVSVVHHVDDPGGSMVAVPAAYAFSRFAFPAASSCSSPCCCATCSRP